MKRHFLAACCAALGACATTGSTIKSGVGDTYMREPPWYAGATPLDGGAIGHLAIVFAPEFGIKTEPGTDVQLLLADMNRYLDSLAISVPMGNAVQAGTPPDIQFGCERSGGAFDCEDDPGDKFEHRLAVARPSRSWIDSLRTAASRASVKRVLVINLEIGNYFPEQKNLKGSKMVRLGSDYDLDVPWLTALNKPVNVLQLTGALMDTTGLAMRAGAEGIGAKRTNVVLSGLGVQSLMSDEDIAKLRTARREDLPGQPLVWQNALRNLVVHLTGQRID